MRPCLAKLLTMDCPFTGLLERQLVPLQIAVVRGEAILISDEVLATLAGEVPDLRERLGVRPRAMELPPEVGELVDGEPAFRTCAC